MYKENRGAEQYIPGCSDSCGVQRTCSTFLACMKFSKQQLTLWTSNAVKSSTSIVSLRSHDAQSLHASNYHFNIAWVRFTVIRAPISKNSRTTTKAVESCSIFLCSNLCTELPCPRISLQSVGISEIPTKIGIV